MPYAIRLHEQGGPEVMKWEDFDPGEPGQDHSRAGMVVGSLVILSTTEP